MITIYHNPRCTKSRNGLSLVKESGKPYRVIEYVNEPLSESELAQIIMLLKIKPLELVRKNEAIWKEQYKGKELSDNDIISALAAHPKLIERPIVVNGDKAVIGRPTELIETII